MLASQFTRNIKPAVDQELSAYKAAQAAGKTDAAFTHLERAHILGQESTSLHVKVHCLMLIWAIKNANTSQWNAGEIAGQLFRIVGAATKTALGLVPIGNTGGANISPFKKLPLDADTAELIAAAKRR